MVKNSHNSTLLRQQGVFIVEFALIAMFITTFLVFVSDMTASQTMHGQLQRLSYSGVNIIKERTQLYGGSGRMTADQAGQLFGVLKNSLTRTMNGFEPDRFGMHVEQLIFNDAGNCNETGDDDDCGLESFSLGREGCLPALVLQNRNELFLKTSWGNPVTLYQVTLCYQGVNWYGNLVGKDFSRLQSSSLMMGR